MERYRFYDKQAYRQVQSDITRRKWSTGVYDFLTKTDLRECERKSCKKKFSVIPSNPKKFCSRNCAAIFNNSRRRWSEEVKQKIAHALQGRAPTINGGMRRGMILVPRIEVICQNIECGKKLIIERWKKPKYCSNKCSMRVIGGRPTSPWASRGKAGVRKDISPNIYFYSRWEANMARLYTYLGITWQYAPKVFDIGGQMYTPDFYLPETDTYVEVKNFWWKYSIERDEKFRKRHKQIHLEVILKNEYLELEKEYAHLIPNWEYKNSPF